MHPPTLRMIIVSFCDCTVNCFTMVRFVCGRSVEGPLSKERWQTGGHRSADEACGRPGITKGEASSAILDKVTRVIWTKPPPQINKIGREHVDLFEVVCACISSETRR